MDNDAKSAVAEPSPATTAPETDLAKFTPAQRDDFWAKGTLPNKAAETTQEAAPADPPKEVTSEAKAETAADPEPAEKSQEKKGHQPKPDAEKRISELTARTKQLEADLEAERSRKREADTKPPAKDAKPEAPKYTRPKPTIDDKDEKGADKYTTHDDYLEALVDWKAEQKVAEYKQQQAQEAALSRVNQAIDDARKRYLNADDVLKPALQSLLQPEAIHPAVRHMLEDSPVMFDLAYALASDPTEFQKFLTAAKANPTEALRRLVITEKLVMEELEKGGTDKGEGKERGADGKFVAKDKGKDAEEGKAKSEDSPEKPKTKAPPPPSEVGGRGTASGDPLGAAVRAGDVRAAFAEMDRRALGK